MTKSQTILKNIAWNLVGFAVQAAVVFFLTPYVLEELGDVRYGLWILILSLTGHYGLLSLGLRGGVNQYLTRYISQHDYLRMNSVVSTSCIALAMVGALMMGISTLCAFLLPKVIDIPVELKDDIIWSLLIVGLSAGLQMPLHVFTAVFTATQRFDITNVISIATRALSAGLICLSLSKGYGLMGLSLASLISELFGNLLHWKIAHNIVPELAFKRELFSRERLNEMMSFGIWSFVFSIAASIFEASDALVIGAMMPFAAVAFYSLSAGITRQLESILVPISLVFFPAATAIDAKGGTDLLRDMYLRGSRLTLIALTIVSVPTSLWAADFFRLWVGEEYLRGTKFSSVAVIFLILLIALAAKTIPAIGLQILLATRKVRPTAFLRILEAVANLILSVVLIGKFGLIGVALGTLISIVTFRTFWILLLIERELGVSRWSYVRESLARPLLMATVSFMLLAVYKSNVASVSSFSELMLHGFVGGLTGVITGLTIGLEQSERQNYIYTPIQRARTKFMDAFYNNTV